MEDLSRKRTTPYQLRGNVVAYMWIFVMILMITQIGMPVIFGLEEDTSSTSIKFYGPYLVNGILLSNIISGILTLDGLLGKNILQVGLVSVISLINVLVLFVFLLAVNQTADYWIYMGLHVIAVIQAIYSLGLCYLLSADFGWSYYKSFGPNKDLARAHTIRKSAIVLKKLLLLRYLSLLKSRELVNAGNTGGIHLLLALLLDTVVLLLFFSSPNEEIVLVRWCDILGSLALCVIGVYTIGDQFARISQYSIDSTVLDPFILVDSAIRIPLNLSLVVLLYKDMQNYGKGLKGMRLGKYGKRLPMS